MISVLESGQKIGTVGIGVNRRKEVHAAGLVATDGDTVSSRVPDSLGVRFLGVDAPETVFTVKVDGATRRLPLNDPAWEAFLASALEQTFTPAMSPWLKLYLSARLQMSATPARNHYDHGIEAKNALNREIEQDISALGTTREKFRFHLAFAVQEAFDKYGRLLCYINRKQKRDSPLGAPPPYYQERLLAAGLVVPFFIWPNVDPFIRIGRKRGLPEAVILPDGHAGPARGRMTVSQLRQRAHALAKSRADFAAARTAGLGVCRPGSLLALEPNEVRFLSSAKPPRRWVLDLSGNHPDVLIQPQFYFTVPNNEDRLFIPEEYVPLFVEAEWRTQTDAEAEAEARAVLQVE
jgi:endonuclease YncB( thermonuclease family)